jgi:CrcB protein
VLHYPFAPHVGDIARGLRSRQEDDGMAGPEPGVGGAEPVDPDVDMRRPEQRRELRQRPSVLAAIAAGGALGAIARYGVGLALPHAPDGWPWSTLLINASGCLLIGVLMVLILEVWVAHRLVRPFLGVGVLGGYTTFSTYAVEAQQLIGAGRPGLALTYLAATVVVALLAVQVGLTLTRAFTVVTTRVRGGRR